MKPLYTPLDDPLDVLSLEMLFETWKQSPTLHSLNERLCTNTNVRLGLFAWSMKEIASFSNKSVRVLHINRISLLEKKGNTLFVQDTLDAKSRIVHPPSKWDLSEKSSKYITSELPNSKFSTFRLLSFYPDLPCLDLDQTRAAKLQNAFTIGYRLIV